MNKRNADGQMDRKTSPACVHHIHFMQGMDESKFISVNLMLQLL